MDFERDNSSIDFQLNNSLSSSEDQLLQGVNIVQSVTCQMLEYPKQVFESQDLLDYSDWAERTTKQTLGTNLTVQQKDLITYHEYVKLVMENNKLKLQNQKLKSKIEENSLITSIKKATMAASAFKNLTAKSTQEEQSIKKSINELQDQKQNKFSDIFQRCSSSIEAIRNFVVMEEHCQLIKVQKQFLSFLDDLSVMIDDFDRQKNALQREIEVLKSSNESLSFSLEKIDNKFYDLITNFHLTPKNKPTHPSQTTFVNQSFGTTKIQQQENHQYSEFPYIARTFSHSLQEIQALSIKQQELQNKNQSCYKCLDTLIDGMLCLKAMLQSNQPQKQHCSQNFISMAKGDKLKTILKSIAKRISFLLDNQHNQLQKFMFQQPKEQSSCLKDFLNVCEKQLQHFFNESKKSKEPGIYLFNIQLTYYISFLQIFMTEYMNGVKAQVAQDYIASFWRLITLIKMRCKQNSFKSYKSYENYLTTMEQFLNDMASKCSQTQ